MIGQFSVVLRLEQWPYYDGLISVWGRVKAFDVAEPVHYRMSRSHEADEPRVLPRALPRASLPRHPVLGGFAPTKTPGVYDRRGVVPVPPSVGPTEKYRRAGSY